MKKTILQLLAFIIILGTFTACANTKSAESPANDIDIEATPAIKIEPIEDEPEERELHLGEIANNSKYTNTYADLTFTLPEGWEFGSDNDLAMLTGREMSGLREDRSALLEYTTRSPVYDMMAVSEDGTATISVSFENTVLYDLGNSLTEGDYLDSLEEKYAELWSEAARSEVLIGNHEYTELSVSYDGIEVYEKIFVRRVDEYMFCIKVMSFGEISTDYIGVCFS